MNVKPVWKMAPKKDKRKQKKQQKEEKQKKIEQNVSFTIKKKTKCQKKGTCKKFENHHLSDEEEATCFGGERIT